jgi:hypothetical protein
MSTDASTGVVEAAPVLGVRQVNEIIVRRAYKPGWVFAAYLGDTTQQVMLMIGAQVEDSYNPGQTVPLDIRSPVPGFALASELAFDKWLAWRLQQVEIHEAQEWYRRPRRNGEGWTPVFNPHAQGADRDQWPIVKRS